MSTLFDNFFPSFLHTLQNGSKPQGKLRRSCIAAAAGIRLLYNKYKYIYSTCFLDKAAGRTYYGVIPYPV